jgi:hypothetical protein
MNSSMHLHIVSYTIPYPADYGGAIDIFYKIKALSESGVKIHLHCFKYDRQPHPVLDAICYKVYYYERKEGLKYNLSKLPFIVKTRDDDQLLDNLLNDTYPILFEGLHTTLYLGHSALANRIKIVRLHNIEHEYYDKQAQFERKFRQKLFFKIEAWKLRRYERVLKHAQALATISQNDYDYYNTRFPKVFILRPFHPFEQVESIVGKGDYALFHGDLSIAENSEIAQKLVRHVFSNVPYRLTIAGKRPDDELLRLTGEYSNITLVANPAEPDMYDLIRNAHINFAMAWHQTGMKLKLVYSLYLGRHCIANANSSGSDFQDQVINVENLEDARDIVTTLFNSEFTLQDKEKRQAALECSLSNKLGVNILVDIIKELQ